MSKHMTNYQGYEYEKWCVLLSYQQAIENTFFYERVRMILFWDPYLLIKLIAVYAGRNISFSSISDRKWKEETLKIGKYVWYL